MTLELTHNASGFICSVLAVLVMLLCNFANFHDVDFNRGNMIATNYLLLMADGDNTADSLAPETQMCEQRFGSVDET